MSNPTGSAFRRVVQSVGSLWFAAVLLVMLMLAMACATIFESSHGTPQAKFYFYQAPWFSVLLLLFGVNVTAAALARYPYTRRHVGFLLTHAGLVVTLIGAWITSRYAVDAHLGLMEGESSRQVVMRETDVLTLKNRVTNASASVELGGRAFRAFSPVDPAPLHRVELSGVTVEVEAFLPHSAKSETLVNDNPRANPALQVAVDFGGAGHVGHGHSTWLFADRPQMLGMQQAVFRVVSDEAEWARLGSVVPAGKPDQDGVVHVSMGETTHEVALSEALDGVVAIADTGYSVRVLRYLPHANVGPNNTLINVSPRPENPAIELELSGPKGTEQRKVFANFPEFGAMHGESAAPDVKVTFTAPEGGSARNLTPIELVVGPNGAMRARFFTGEGKALVQDAALDEWLETPWPGMRLAVRQYFPNARRELTVEALEVPKQDVPLRPALRLGISRGADRSQMWVQKYDNPQPFTVDGVTHELSFASKTIDLGFAVRLDKFNVGYYPGGRRPRSFESRITIVDPTAGGEQARIISMNHPTTHRGFTFFQSSYQMDGGRTASFLSVSRDPGLPVVYLGYISTIVGMIVVLVQRMAVRPKQGLTLPIGIGVCESDRMSRSGDTRALSAEGVRAGNGKAITVGGRGALTAVLAITNLALSARGAELPKAINPAPLRGMVVQHDGRWPPLDTLARDVVKQVTGQTHFRGAEPVAVLLAWTFDPRGWMQEPLIPIRNAELRRELQLPADQEEFSFLQLAGHEPLRRVLREAASLPEGSKPDPLQSKAGDINGKLMTLQSVFEGEVIRPIPHREDVGGAWKAIAGAASAGQDSAADSTLQGEWAALKNAFLADDAAAFDKASQVLLSKAAGLPAAYRPPPGRIETELHYNALRPYRTAWLAMVAGALLSAAAMFVRRRWFDAVAIAGMLAGFVLLSYGLSLRWTIAGRIPAANMFESLLFLSWGMGAFAILAMLVQRQRIVPLTASAMGALALLLADVLPMDPFVRPIPPVLLDTVWMSIHVPTIMVSYSVLALGVLFAHLLVVIMAVAPTRQRLIGQLDGMHYWYIHVGSILLLAGIVTGSMWAASSWGRYWGWDPKEVWSLVALLGYLAIMHVRVDREKVPAWACVLGLVLMAALFVIVVPRMGDLTSTKALGLVGAAGAMALFVFTQGTFATALKSIVCFWLIVMTYVGVNYVLGIGLHSYGFGTGAMARWMIFIGSIDLAFMALFSVVYWMRRKSVAAPSVLRGAVLSA